MKELSLSTFERVMAFFSSCGGGKSNQINERKMLITIDYSKSIDDLTTMGNYDYINPGIFNNAFVKGGNDQSGTIMERTAILLNFSHGISSEDVVAQMTVRGLRPATARELFTLGHTYHSLQHELTIIALGSQTTASEVPELWGRNFGLRFVDLRHWYRYWYSSHGFLAFPVDS